MKFKTSTSPMKKSKEETKAAPSDLILSFNASAIAYAHTAFAYAAFFSALIVGCYLHYHKIVENSSYGYPDEWFPSVSATIGDRYPERSLFQVLIALTAGPRFMLLFFNFLLASSHKTGSVIPFLGFALGFVRTFTCGGWVYITSTDDHDWHDIFMISYIVLTIPWTVITTITSPKGSFVRKGRFYTGSSFFATIVPLIYWFIQHKVHDRPGAYSTYAYFEWSLILLDVGFDAWSIVDFSQIEIRFYGSGIQFAPFALEKSSAVASKKEDTVDEFSCLEFTANLINSMIFWTVLTSMYLCVWYFPLWYMGISGYETVILSLIFFPLVLVVPAVRKFLATYPFLLRVSIVLLGIASYKLQEPTTRLLCVASASGIGIIAIAIDQWALWHSPQKYTSNLTTLALGFLITTVLKFGSYSNNPFWVVMHKPNGGQNELGVLIGLLGALFTPRFLQKTVKKPTPEVKGGYFLLAAAGLGSLFFAFQLYLSDSASLALWTWEGYPIRGPTPITAAPFFFGAVILALIAILKVKDHGVFGSWWFSAFGTASILVFHNARHWVSFAGAVGYTFYLVAVTPVIFKSIVGYNPALLFTTAFVFNIIISLTSIWIVAYAFVPGGPLFRERTDMLLVLSHGTLFAGIFNYRLRSTAIGANKTTSKLFKQVMTVLTVIVAFSTTVFIKRYPTVPHKPFNEDSKSFTAGIWCVHFGLDNDMWASETRMANLLREAEVDIIGLLESDTQRLIGGTRDFTQTIAEELGMYADYGPGPNKHTWGSALLSKFPIIKSEHHLLPSPVGELAPAILATLDIYGEHVDVVVFHSGQEEDVEDRRLQSLYLQELMGKSSNPLVLLSYLVTEPLQGNYNTYVSEKSRVYDIDSTDWDRWCEYILFRDLKKVAYARISRSTITDTELQIAKFKLLTDEQRQQNDVEFLYGNHFIDESEVPENLRMPQLFRGDGVRGHRYHVFDEPRYFAE